MDSETIQAGIDYEKLIKRALIYEPAADAVMADRRVYYLLYYIRQGVDLRQTGYLAQFELIRSNVLKALDTFCRNRLNEEERTELNRLYNDVKDIYNEAGLNKLIVKALATTKRMDRVS